MKGISLLITSVLLFFLGMGVLAQEIELPNPGLTPESRFYLLDKLGETIQEFFTFNPEAKARLQLTFAAERIAEIKLVLETKGIGAKGLEVAQARLKTHAAKAADIVKKEKEKGKDVAKLAGEIVDNFHLQRKAVKKVFENVKQEFFAKKEQLHQELLVAIEAGDVAAQDRIRAELTSIEAARDEAEAKKDAAIVALEAEKDGLQDELEEKKRQEDEARDVAEETEEAKKEAEEKQKELEEKIQEEQAKAEAKMKEAEEREEEEKETLEEQQKEEEEKLKEAEEEAKEAEEKEEVKQLSPILQQLQGVWKLERILKTSGIDVDKELEVKYEEYLSFRENKVCGTAARDACYLDYVSFAMEGEKIMTSKIIGLLGVETEKVYFRNGKVEYHGFSEKGDIEKHFYGKISSQPLEEISSEQ